MINMNDKLMVDRDCFERGCMSIPHTHVRPIKDNEVVWMVREQAEPTRWKSWVGLTNEEVNAIYSKIAEKVGKHWDEGGTTMMFPETLYDAIEAMLKERNT